MLLEVLLVELSRERQNYEANQGRKMHEQREGADVGAPMSYFIATSSGRHTEEKADGLSHSLKEWGGRAKRGGVSGTSTRWQGRTNDEIKRRMNRKEGYWTRT